MTEWLRLSDASFNVAHIMWIDLSDGELTIWLTNGQSFAYTDSDRGLADSADYAAILSLVSPN